MRSRTIREGSVGLLILVGLAVFVGLVLWIRGLRVGNRSYEFTVGFPNVAGMKEGATVRYRGVDVGKITKINATTNGVDVTIEIASADLVIPRNAVIEANQSGLIGETSVDITPKRELTSGAQSIDPLNRKCNSEVVICNRDRLNGQIGVSFIELLRNTDRLTTIYTDPAFFDNINSLAKNASLAASGVAQLTGELSLLTRSVRQEVGTFSKTSNSLTAVANQTANRIGNTADQYSLTARELNQLIASANELVVTNRATLVGTLTSVSQTSDELRLVLRSVSPTLERVNSTIGSLNSRVEGVNVTTLLGNLETFSANLAILSTNAAEASANLRDISSGLNSPTNALVLQQLLDSARVTFENAQKITSDLDDLTGDPAFRDNLKELIQGLNKLVSSTEQLEEQIQVAHAVESMSTDITTTATILGETSSLNQPSPTNSKPAETNEQMNQQKQLFNLLPPIPKKKSSD
ncbi:MAG TPA: MCE family protein [Cyanobacteria bacterium UBA12227]|nr:MCE family protein [Cyanobacteria bacterium UBA12227]HAX87027.1 MCE family protein [Cyanobacteria bacterium UBA11370]HBY80641.1 MCE family protein [Cyanobacteria bacterium UBA11148]